MRRLSSDTLIPLAMFSACHFTSGWREMLARITRNGEIFGAVFLGIVFAVAMASLMKPRTVTLKHSLILAIAIPYIASIVSYVLALVAFYLEEHDSPVAFFPWEMAVLALFAPYFASTSWSISVYAVIWLIFDAYRKK